MARSRPNRTHRTLRRTTLSSRAARFRRRTRPDALRAQDDDDEEDAEEEEDAGLEAQLDADLENADDLSDNEFIDDDFEGSGDESEEEEPMEETPGDESGVNTECALDSVVVGVVSGLEYNFSSCNQL